MTEHLKRWVGLVAAALGIALSVSGAAPMATDAPAVKVSAVAGPAEVAPGGEAVVAVVLDHAQHFHTWPSADQDVLPPAVAEFAIRTQVELAEMPSWVAKVGGVQWPTPSLAKVADPTGEKSSVELMTYQGKAVAYLPLVISKDAPAGEQALTVKVSYQACDEQSCQMPEDVEVSVKVRVGAATAALADPLFKEFDRSVFASMQAASDTAKPEKTETPKVEGTLDAGATRTFLGFIKVNGSGSVALFLLALLGGAVLNLTPCVLPVIPIKILTISQHAKTPGRSTVLGLWMAAGVVAFWVLLAVPVLAFTSFGDPSRVFGIWWVTAGIGAIIAVMALGLMGLFEIRLPQSMYMINPSAETAWGSFLFGVMTAVLGLPCFGFVVGALLPASATASPATVLSVFTAIGLGMALPYLVLSARPGLLKQVPKSGPGSELVKQVMGLLLLAAAAYFIGSGLIGLVSEKPYLAKKLHWWAVALLGVGAGVLMIVRTFQITKRMGVRAFVTLLGLFFVVASGWTAWAPTKLARQNYEEMTAAGAAARDPAMYVAGVWNPYTKELVERAHADGKVVVMDFTAEWCLTCKSLKATVLARDPVKSLLKSPEIVPVVVDLTSRKAEGWEMLRALGYTGIPLLVVEGPASETPWKSNAYSPQQVVDAIAKAQKSQG